MGKGATGPGMSGGGEPAGPAEVMDQFEDLFIACAHDRERGRFLAALKATLTPSPLWAR